MFLGLHIVMRQSEPKPDIFGGFLRKMIQQPLKINELGLPPPATALAL